MLLFRKTYVICYFILAHYHKLVGGEAARRRCRVEKVVELGHYKAYKLIRQINRLEWIKR